MKYEPIYLPPPDRNRASDYFWLACAIVAGIVTIAGLCIIAVEAAALLECLHKGICS